MTTLAERIAAEVMDTIEREKRVNKDDIVAAVGRVVAKPFEDTIKLAEERLAALAAMPTWRLIRNDDAEHLQ